MKLGNYSHPTRDSFPDMPPGMEDPMKILGKHLVSITQILQGEFSLTQNGNHEVVRVRVQHGREFEFRLKTLDGPPQGAWIEKSNLYDEAKPLQWAPVAEDRIKAIARWASAPTNPVEISIFVRGG